jgi:glycosyltransferase involved in cell wall biosynthesis
MSPKITVFIPVYNRQRYIAQTIQSVLDQSYKNFQLLLVDDGSTDDSVDIMRSFTDQRITLIENGENLGIPKTRNVGLEHAQGEYLAILDSDDLMLKDRLKKQSKFLDKHSDYVGVGSWSRYIDDQGVVKKSIVARPVSHKRISASLLFQCAIHNRTFMVRSEAVKKLGYNNNFPRCQDYELLYRLSKHAKLHNIPAILVAGRKHDQQITRNTSEIGDQMKKIIASQCLNDLQIEYTAVDLHNHIQLARCSQELRDLDFLEWAEQWLSKLLKANQNTKIFNQTAFRQICFRMWIKTIFGNYSAPYVELNKKRLFSNLNKQSIMYLAPPYM